MPYETTVGKLLLKHYSPADTHAFLDSKELDKKNIGTFFADLADKHPDVYEKVVSNLTRLGFEAATRFGSTVRLTDLLPPKFKDEKFKQLYKDIDGIKAKKLPHDKEVDEIGQALNKFNSEVDKLLIEEGIKENKTLAKVVKAGARGSPAQYRQTIFGPVAVNDNKGGILTDFIVDRSFAEGLTLPQYLAHTFGARQASAATKLAVADAGYLGKQLARAGMTLTITEHDCGTHNGIDVNTGDKEYIGAFLAHPVGKYNYNNEVTPSMLADLHSQHISHIVVRSPITCQASKSAHPNALCQICAGRRELGLPMLGSHLGITAGSTLAEPLAQGSLNCLSTNTLVRMADYSTKEIQNIEPGEMVLGADNQGHTFPVEVLNRFDQGLQPTNEYRFRIGCTDQFTTLQATENHKIFCNVKKWSCAAQKDNHKLQVLPLKHIGRDFNAVRAIQHIADYEDKEPFAYLIGALMGDGCYTASVGSPHFSCADPLLVSAINAKYKEYGIQLKLCAGQTIYYRVGLGKPCNVNPIKKLLQSYGMWNKYAHEKVIVPKMYGWNNDSISELLAGLFDTDGSICVSNVRDVDRLVISFSSTSKQLAQQISDLLAWRFCVYTTNLTKVRSAGEANSVHDQWAFTINDRQSQLNFYKHIPLIGIKTQTLASLIPLISDKKSVGYTMKRSVEVNSLGLTNCWDLEVDSEDALFVLANGIIVHNSKHSGGGARGKTAFGGFKYVNQLFNVPETFVHEAPLSHSEGHVSEIRGAAQGGNYVVIRTVGGKDEEHYVHPDLFVTVHKGQLVEPGDVLSQGIPNPAKIVKLKGLGEGRAYFAKAIKETFENSGLGGINKRNFDTIAKTLITHVKITNPKGMGEYLPDSIVNYHSIEKDYTPRADSKKVRVDQAKGTYLEIPVLHYTIGTRLTNQAIDNLKKHGIEYVTVNTAHPEFEPDMQRLLDVPAHEHDWMHALYSTNLERRLLKAVNTGASSDIKGPSPVPGLAYAVGFGEKRAGTEELQEECLSFE